MDDKYVKLFVVTLLAGSEIRELPDLKAYVDKGDWHIKSSTGLDRYVDILSAAEIVSCSMMFDEGDMTCIRSVAEFMKKSKTSTISYDGDHLFIKSIAGEDYWGIAVVSGAPMLNNKRSLGTFVAGWYFDSQNRCIYVKNNNYSTITLADIERTVKGRNFPYTKDNTGVVKGLNEVSAVLFASGSLAELPQCCVRVNDSGLCIEASSYEYVQSLLSSSEMIFSEVMVRDNVDWMRAIVGVLLDREHHSTRYAKNTYLQACAKGDIISLTMYTGGVRSRDDGHSLYDIVIGYVYDSSADSLMRFLSLDKVSKISLEYIQLHSMFEYVCTFHRVSDTQSNDVYRKLSQYFFKNLTPMHTAGLRSLARMLQLSGIPNIEDYFKCVVENFVENK